MEVAQLNPVPSEARQDGPSGRRAAVGNWRPARLRWEVLALLELWSLCGLAIAQPMLDITGRSPDFFLFHGADAGRILLLVGMVTVLPPLLLWAAGAATGLAGGTIRRAVHAVTIGGLSTALAIQAGKWLLPLRGLPLALLAVGVGAAATLAYLRWMASRHLLRLSAIGPLVSVLLFVFASPTSSLVLGPREATAAAGRPVGPHPPLVVIFFDELPQLSLLDDSGRLDARHFPNFARLAAGSTWYRNATTVSGSTTEAIPGMLTGRYPLKRAAPHYSQYPNNLFTLLAGSYELRAYESVIQLCPPERCARTAPSRGGLRSLLGESAALLKRVVSPRGADQPGAALDFAEPVSGQQMIDQRPAANDVKFRWKRRAENQPVRFGEFVAGLRPTPRPTLHFLHLLLPHQPFQYLPSGMRYPHYRLGPGEGWMNQLWRQRHLLQVRYTDSLLGVAMDALRESGLYDDAMVLVTADHGMSFNPDARPRAIGPAPTNAAEVAWVPLFIKAPGQREGRIDIGNWEHVDLLPTVADYAGVSVPWHVDGRSARRRAPATAGKRYYSGKPGQLLELDSAAGVRTVLDGPDALPYSRAQPLPQLLGRTAIDLPTSDAGIRASAANEEEFDDVRPDTGMVPALVHGDLPASVATGRYLAIALNGTIAAVVPVMREAANTPRFAGLIQDETLFRSGANRLELFLVDDDGQRLRRLHG